MISEDAVCSLAMSAAGFADASGKATGNATRRELRLTMGVQNVREVPRCEYSVALQTVKLWDDYKTMKAIKAKGGAPHA